MNAMKRGFRRLYDTKRMKRLFRRLYDTKRWIFHLVLTILFCLSILGYISELFYTDYTWNTLYIHFGLTLGIISIFFNLIILSKFNKTVSKSNYESLLLLNNIVQNDSEEIFIKSPSFIVGDILNLDKLEFEIYITTLKNLSNSGVNIQFNCLETKFDILDELKNLDYESIISNNNFKSSKILQFHYKLAQEFYKDNSTYKAKYLKEVINTLLYFKPTGSTSSKVKFNVTEFTDTQLFFLKSNSKALLGSWKVNGQISLNLIENIETINIISND